MERSASGFDSLEELAGPLRIPAAERTYGRQFAQVYDYRLAVLRRRVLASATDAYGAKPPYVERLLDIPPKQLCFVIGTVYAAMRLKPDVLQEIAREVCLGSSPQQSIAPQSVPTYADPGHDELFLEDPSGRVRLVGERIRPGTRLAHLCVTGAVIGVFGAETPDGDLEVADVALAGPPAPLPRALPPAGEEAPYMVLASGLRMGGMDADADMHYELLLEWLTGELGARDAARISSVVLAGDSVCRANWERPESSVGERRHAQQTPTPFASLDPFLAELCATLDALVVLPGAEDPSSATLPQQPLQRGLLPRAAQWSNLHCTTNPAWFAVHGATCLATSGQNVEDLLRYWVDGTEETSRALSMACATLQWSHMAPTAPDTLCTLPTTHAPGCYPFKQADPFVIRAAPDVYVIGNQARFETTTLETRHGPGSPHTIRVVLVPRFAAAHEVVLLNMATLEPRVVQIHA